MGLRALFASVSPVMAPSNACWLSAIPSCGDGAESGQRVDVAGQRLVDGSKRREGFGRRPSGERLLTVSRDRCIVEADVKAAVGVLWIGGSVPLLFGRGCHARGCTGYGMMMVQ